MKHRIKIIGTLFFNLLFGVWVSAQSQHEFYVENFGAKADGVTLNTKAIQSAIDKCSESGGMIFFTAGKYLTGSLELKSNVEIYLQNGATILGSTKLEDYTSNTPSLKSYNDLFLRYSLFYAEKADNISIQGEGTVDGQGSLFKVKTKAKPDRYMNRPFVIRFVECKNVKIENVTLQNSAMWMQQYLVCEGLIINGIKVFNHANQNNDMMDIDGCKNVIITNCSGDTDDDGITLKSTSLSITENVTITNCVISSHCNAIKLGTESIGGFKNISISNIVVKPSQVEKIIFGSPGGTSGITLTTVDGGILDGVTISNIKIDGPDVPICFRLGNRARKYSDDAPIPAVGIFKNVIITNVVAENVKSIGCSITGIPNHYIEKIFLNNIKISFAGGVKKGDFKNNVPELEDNYPEGTMWGNLPAYGFYIRHVKEMILDNVKLSFALDDQRSAIILDDVNDSKIYNLNASVSEAASNLIGITNSHSVYFINSSAIGKTKTFLSISDVNSNNIFLMDCDLKNFINPVSEKVMGQVRSIFDKHSH